MTDEEIKAMVLATVAEEKKKNGISGGDGRPTDLDVFFAILPGIVGAQAGKQVDTRSAIATSFLMARETVGQCCYMGIARPATMCTDGSHLAISPQNVSVPGVQGAVAPNQNQAERGVMIQQYPTPVGGQQIVGAQAPGAGGLVTQYPTVAAGQQVVGQGGGLGTMNGDGRGMRATVVAMVPNDPNVHPIAVAPNAPQQGFPQAPQQGFAPQPGFQVPVPPPHGFQPPPQGPFR